MWPRSESVAFLQARSRHTDPQLLDELAALVGDLPLAVEEAAAYLEQTGEDLGAYLGLVPRCHRPRGVDYLGGASKCGRCGRFYTRSATSC